MWPPSSTFHHNFGARRLVSATLHTAESPAVAERRVVNEDLRLEEEDNHPNYDVEPTGMRFVLMEADAAPGLIAVFDWASELRRR